MNFLRRGTGSSVPEGVDTDTSESADDADDRGVVAVGERRTQTAGKGRPTPSRRDAQGKKRGPVAPAPKTQREAFRRARSQRGTKEERRAARAERSRRMAAGDDRVLPARDRGPVRAFARDLVDSRRHVMGLFMPLALVVFAFIIFGTTFPDLQAVGSLLTAAMLMTMALEGVMLGRYVNRRIRAKFPDEEFKAFGMGWYCFTRATQIRKLRLPKPRVVPGDEIV